MSSGGALTRLTAELSGVRAEQLRDRALVTGLAIAAVGSAGLATLAPPAVHERGDGELTVVLVLEPGHLLAHTFPARGLMLVEVLTTSTHDPAKALDVFSRRLTPAAVQVDRRAIG